MGQALSFAGEFFAAHVIDQAVQFYENMIRLPPEEIFMARQIGADALCRD